MEAWRRGRDFSTSLPVRTLCCLRRQRKSRYPHMKGPVIIETLNEVKAILIEILQVALDL
jgi:hypothetical protein